MYLPQALSLLKFLFIGEMEVIHTLWVSCLSYFKRFSGFSFFSSIFHLSVVFTEDLILGFTEIL